MHQAAYALGLGDPAPKPLAHHEFRPDINGLRALAVLSVLGFHAGLNFLPGGFVGVDIFFVISGFLISRIILSERDAGEFSLADFYGKRVKRILPALLVVVSVSWAVGWFWLEPPDFRRFGGHVEASSYFSVNLWLFRQSGGPAAYFNPASRYLPLLHLWSLSVEEQFYLLWPALLLLLFKARRLLAPAIGLIFVASLGFSIYETNVNSTAAFYFLSSRAWELALGALLAQREVFSSPLRASPRASNLFAALGVLLMLASVALLSEAAPWPGFLALAPTLGCALVIATPGAKVSHVLLGNRVAQFFGRISYPLYLWHWPLLSFAHQRVGDHLPIWLAASLMGLATLLAYLTWKFIETPVAVAYSKRPLRVAAPLLALLAFAGLAGSVTRQNDGFPQRFPAPVLAAFKYRTVAMDDLNTKMACTDGRGDSRAPLDQERKTIRAFFANSDCLKVKDPALPIIVLVGDSHAMHLIAGLESVYAGRANLVKIGGGGCPPLIAQSDWRIGMSGSMRCLAVGEEAMRDIVALKPAAIVVAAYFSEFYDGYFRHYPGFLKDFDANVEALRAAGSRSPIFIMGQVPTWSPGVPSLVGRELRSAEEVEEYSRAYLDPQGLATDELFAAHKWGDNVFYLSQTKALCNDQGCRRLVGPRVPEDMIAFDYGHYTPAGSIYAVKNILAPALDVALGDPK